MKFATTVAIFAAAAATAGAQPTETNAERMARGLPPMAPVRRWSPTRAADARRSVPSSSPPSNQCNTGAIQCCNSVTSANNPLAKLLLGLLGVVGLNANTAIGVTCSPLSVLGLNSGSCTQQAVCCQNNSFKGVIAVGCSPINL